MRQTHVAGEKLFVDYAGDTVPVFDAATGEERRAHVFVAVLGASNYTYAEARWSEGLADWIGAHVNTLAFLGGAPKLLVCDNLRAGVTAACRYEPGINRTYQEMAAHYGAAVLPTRVRRPRDKAKVEVAVLIVQRFILARLRNRRFLSLGELNEAIREVLGDLNARLMRKLGASRREFFDTIDRPALLPLPPDPYAYAEWRRCRVAPDYHVEVHGHFYSVPSRLIREVVEARIQKLAAGDWLDRKQNLLVIGPTGVGKFWIACALGHKACRDNLSVVYHRVPRLLEALALARGDGRYGRLLKTLGRVQLLILDDWGLAPLTGEQRRDLLEIMDDRHERGSTIVTSQVPVEHWHEVIGDPTIADAVLDRLVHNAHRLLLKGESLRKRAAKALMLDAEAVN
jgi:transposase